MIGCEMVIRDLRNWKKRKKKLSEKIVETISIHEI